MNLESGHYFSTRNIGALVWACIEQGAAVDAISGVIVNRYQIEKIDADRALAKFVGELLQHGLVREAVDGENTRPATLDDATGWPATWSAPQVEVYTDMEDLLLLDPIHDVSDAGWPMPLPDQPAA